MGTSERGKQPTALGRCRFPLEQFDLWRVAAEARSHGEDQLFRRSRPKPTSPLPTYCRPSHAPSLSGMPCPLTLTGLPQTPWPEPMPTPRKTKWGRTAKKRARPKAPAAFGTKINRGTFAPLPRQIDKGLHSAERFDQSIINRAIQSAVADLADQVVRSEPSAQRVRDDVGIGLVAFCQRVTAADTMWGVVLHVVHSVGVPIFLVLIHSSVVPTVNLSSKLMTRVNRRWLRLCPFRPMLAQKRTGSFPPLSRQSNLN